MSPLGAVARAAPAGPALLGRAGTGPAAHGPLGLRRGRPLRAPARHLRSADGLSDRGPARVRWGASPPGPCRLRRPSSSWAAPSPRASKSEARRRAPRPLRPRPHLQGPRDPRPRPARGGTRATDRSERGPGLHPHRRPRPGSRAKRPHHRARGRRGGGPRPPAPRASRRRRRPPRPLPPLGPAPHRRSRGAATPGPGRAPGPEGPRLLRPGPWRRPASPSCPRLPPESFHARLELDWAVDGLEPLAFLLSRVLEPLVPRASRARAQGAGPHPRAHPRRRAARTAAPCAPAVAHG